MIATDTVLILGAGASQPYGFPVGRQLKARILNKLVAGKGAQQDLLREGFEAIDIETFRNSLQLSGVSSVDAFLEHRPEFLDVGKAAIARLLIPCENEMDLFPPDTGGWYDYLYAQLNAPFESFTENRLKIITFNYDRSLEHYLYTALRNTYGKSADETAQLARSIRILHVHGHLGYLPWQPSDADTADVRSYTGSIDLPAVAVARRNIRIVREGGADDPAFVEAREWLTATDRIMFLGFGYHPENLKRLGAPDLFARKQWYGTYVGSTEAERNDVQRRLTGANARVDDDVDVLTFLRKTGFLAGGP